MAAEVRAAIARAGLPRARVADAAGMHRQLLSRKLNGHTPFLIEEVVAIAKAIDVPPDELVSAVVAAA